MQVYKKFLEIKLKMNEVSLTRRKLVNGKNIEQSVRLDIQKRDAVLVNGVEQASGNEVIFSTTQDFGWFVLGIIGESYRLLTLEQFQFLVMNHEFLKFEVARSHYTETISLNLFFKNIEHDDIQVIAFSNGSDAESLAAPN